MPIIYKVIIKSKLLKWIVGLGTMRFIKICIAYIVKVLNM